VVVNLIGASLPTRNFSLEAVNTEWPARLARMAADAGCLRLLHFSDAGAAADHASVKLRSKAAGDQAVREAFPQATIIK
jgi:NADH dehydrogenase (ubiquinone) 1 alpha subcomplex subunit 9